MDPLLDHLGKSVRYAVRETGPERAQRQRDYIEGFRSDRKPDWQEERLGFPYGPPLILAVMHWVLREQGFDTGAGADFARGRLRGRYARDYGGSEGILARIPRLSERLALVFEVDIQVHEDGAVRLRTTGYLPTWVKAFSERVGELLANTPVDVLALVPPASEPAPRPAAPPSEGGSLLAPGEVLTGPFRGNLLDYSGFATDAELDDLRDGDIPLGRYAFGQGSAAIYGSPLYLSHYRTGAPMLYNGALICAPQNAGKTELILRWAVAANRAGYSVFLVDVKGNLHAKLAGRLRGRVRYFSTDPSVADCDRVNFLAGLEGRTPLEGMRVRQLVEALLPKDGWEEGEQAYFYQNHVNWLSGLLQILLLYRRYYPREFPGGQVDLSHLYQLASSEARLYRTLDHLAAAEAQSRQDGIEPVFPGLDYWFTEIALLADPARGGQRSRDYTYRTLTQSMVNALRPFSRFGTLYQKTSGEADPAPDRFFRFEDLNDQAQPVTLILAAREQDLDDAGTVVSLAVRKLQQFLFDRMSMSNPRPVLLLLDETRRIRGFKANEYITFAREAKAGCVLVYQSLDQIGEPARITEILENVGTQIYLGSLVGNTAKYFMELLPTRFRPTYSQNASFGADGFSHALQTGQEQIGYVTRSELYRLPGGNWPALVYLNDQPRRKPFLVDLDNALSGEPP